MKTKTMIAIALGLAGAAHAEKPGNGRPHKLPPAVLEKFDKDGDGKLNEEERAAAKAEREETMKARKKEMLEKFDKDGDGELNEAEKEEMRAEMKKRMLEKFDKDGDGTLNDEEKAEMHKAMGHRRHRHHDGGGKHPRTGTDKEAPGIGE